jgi:hypothetical protein
MGAFSYCTHIKTIVFPVGLEKIGDEAFLNCEGLEMIEFPESVVSIGKYSFSESGLTEIVIPSSIKKVEKNAFYRCHKLVTVTISEGVEVILALSGDVEGETTSFYIYRQLMQYGVKVTSLARGLGFGDDLEYADELTLGRSIVNRQIFKP